MARRKRLIGLDPGLRKTGWGIVDFDGIAISYVGCGIISPPVSADMSRRLAFLHQSLLRVLKKSQPESAAIEETFVN